MAEALLVTCSILELYTGKSGSSETALFNFLRGLRLDLSFNIDLVLFNLANFIPVELSSALSLDTPLLSVSTSSMIGGGMTGELTLEFSLGDSVK